MHLHPHTGKDPQGQGYHKSHVLFDQRAKEKLSINVSFSFLFRITH
jgi:hypothetical protein